MFQLSHHIISDAKDLLATQENLSLPKEIPKSPHFFVAEASDKTIQAFGGLAFAGKTYKIGTKKAE